MEDFDTTLTGEELVTEVRSSLAGLNATKIPDDTIKQTAERFVIPLLNDEISTKAKSEHGEHQEAFDSAVIAWTAELSFGAWLKFTRLRDREIETFIDPKNYKSDLKERTNLTLRLLNITRPSNVPKHSVTIKHDGIKRKVDLNKPWVLDK